MKKQKKIRINYKRMVRDILLTIIIIYSFIGTCISLASSKPESYEGDYNTYYVSKGETLWSIAKKQDYNMDIRQVIHLIECDNNINSILQPGQELILREYYK